MNQLLLLLLLLIIIFYFSNRNEYFDDSKQSECENGYYHDDKNNECICNGKEVNGVCKPINPNAIQCKGIGYISSCKKSLGDNYGPCSRGLCYCNENKNMGIKNGKCQLCDNKKGE
jgi:hypothetical protein